MHWTAALSDPLRRSRLALAGANRDDSGIFSAEEVLTLDLSGTELVTLSACRSSSGDVQLGEGVLGFARAFAVAGARSVVMSVWETSDELTRRFMQTFYRNVSEGAMPPSALRAAKLKIVRQCAEHLVVHTGESLAGHYRALVERVRRPKALLGAGDSLSRAVAHNYHRLLAVKDEWEVARLCTHPDFKATLEREFEGDYRLAAPQLKTGGGSSRCSPVDPEPPLTRSRILDWCGSVRKHQRGYTSHRCRSGVSRSRSANP
jgi:CHAT domain-containing protein